MIRGMKIYGLLFLIDLHYAFLRNPLRIFHLLFAIVFGPLLLFSFAVAPRENQDDAAAHGLNCNPPEFIRRRLEAMLQ